MRSLDVTRRRFIAPAIVSVLSAALVAATPALAQDPPAGAGVGSVRRPGEQARDAAAASTLTPEQSARAWNLQATDVATMLKLDGQQTGELARAYVDARQRFDELTAHRRSPRRRPDRGQGGDDAGRAGDAPRANAPSFAEIREAMAGIKNGFREKVATLVPEAQVERVMLTLGAFDQRWDRLVHVATDFKLGATETAKAIREIETYIAAVHTGRKDRAGNKARTAARKSLLDALKPMLDDEQFAIFDRVLSNASAAARPRPVRPPRGNAGRGGGARGPGG